MDHDPLDGTQALASPVLTHHVSAARTFANHRLRFESDGIACSLARVIFGDGTMTRSPGGLVLPGHTSQPAAPRAASRASVRHGIHI